MYNTNAFATYCEITRYFRKEGSKKCAENATFKAQSATFVKDLVNGTADQTEINTYLSETSLDYATKSLKKECLYENNKTKSKCIPEDILAWYKQNPNALCTFRFFKNKYDCSQNLLKTIFRCFEKHNILGSFSHDGMKHWFNVQTYDTNKSPAVFDDKPELTVASSDEFLEEIVKNYFAELDANPKAD